MTYYLSITPNGYGTTLSVAVEALDCVGVRAAVRATAGLGADYPGQDYSYCGTRTEGTADYPVDVGIWLTLLVYDPATEGETWYDYLVESISDSPPSPSGDSALISQLQSTVASLQTTVATTQQTLAQTAATIAETQTGLQSLLNAAAEDFDPVFAGAVFGFFYCSVFVFYSISKGIGAVLAAVKGGR